ncbi:MAG: AraC family transcriptional regulator [Ruminococcaceae bacterium]|nr:AraC family transcriptional regulator [Oscillospiraceae bacterium]
MKFAHYDYRCAYFLPEEIANGTHDKNFFIVKRRSFIVNQRTQLKHEFEYHTTYVRIYTNDSNIESFNLGVDFSPPDYILEDRCVDTLFLNFIICGKGRINGEPFSAGQFYYTRPLETHTIESDSDDPFVSVWMSFSGSYSQELINKLNEIDTARLFTLDNCSDIMKITEVLLYETSIGERTTSYLKSIIDLFLSYIRSSDPSPQPKIFTSEKTAQLIRESKDYIKNNLKDVTVAALAEAQHYNPKYFSRVFTEAMSMTPQEYITNCRMEWAKNTLIHSSLPVAKIMESIGYTHRNGFTAAFKKKYGHTPAECRKAAKARLRESQKRTK